MSAINRVSIVATSAALSLWASIAPAVTVQDFDSPGTAYTLSQFGSAPGPAVVGGGNPGSAVRLTDAGSGGQNNTVAFDRADVGVAHIVTASYDFNIAAGGAADGFALALLNTTSFGIAGAGPTFSEEPALAGSLGFAYDTFDNGGEGFRSATVYFNGVLISNTPTTDYVDGLYHHVSILANMDAGTVSYQIDNNVIFSNLAVGGLAPYEYRVAFGGRTGGATETVLLDNILAVNDVPEPSTLMLMALGLGGLFAGLRRFKK